MKHKRMIVGCLAALLLATLLCGCNQSRNTKETTPTFPTLPTELTAPKEDPKDVAFTCYNCDFDYYPYCSLGGALEFYILTRKPVDVTDIIVTIPVEQGYNVYVYDDSTMNDYYQFEELLKDSDGTIMSIGGNPLQYQAYLYQTSQGMDWKDLGENG